MKMGQKPGKGEVEEKVSEINGGKQNRMQINGMKG